MNKGKVALVALFLLNIGIWSYGSYNIGRWAQKLWTSNHCDCRPGPHCAQLPSIPL